MTELETMMHAIKYLFLFSMVICYSDEGSVSFITGEVCLKTALEFTKICSFTVKTAQTYFKTDRETCQSKCNVTIYRAGQLMHLSNVYSLHTINVIVGNKSATNNICTSYPTANHLRISCSSWKHDVRQANEQNCQERDAYCFHIGYTCICQCLSGYIMVNGHCLLANVHVGHACSSDLQCTGTGNAGDCRNGVCHCHLGYLQKDGICYLDAQGSTSAHASTPGLLFGGFFLGAFITVGIVFIIYRRFKSSLIRRTEPLVLFTEKVYSLETAARFNHSEPSSSQNTQQEVINSAPHEPSEYSIVSNTDVYNHLYEGEEREESDNYDHACAFKLAE
uniref:Uncharacterized protein LOC111105872 n=1 Tax=Crassostrea virginica TaxID=6565 RepID=A0A8B8B0A8_CRAVI|nr:uncharacterized protein LOC111105872 [Crassostrea virginica]